MSEAIIRYFSELQARITALGEDELLALDAAADVCAASLASRGVIHLYDTGHLISHEMIARTGGLVAYTSLSFSGALDNRNLWRVATGTGPAGVEDDLAAERSLLDWVFAQRTLRLGDVLIIGSVSGTGQSVVELALQSRKRGLKVIAITAPTFSGKLAAAHPSGKRLFEVADIVLDNHAEYGDSFLDIAGFDGKVCPISGVAAAVLMWALTAGIVERMIQRGLEPSVYTSVNLPGGPAAVEEVEASYREKGY
jgi:uncharacterized phosphosugar-binding protein